MDGLVGHLLVKKILKNMLQAVPSATLFYGPEGVGKRTFAKAFAQKIIGSSREHHPDIRIYTPEGELHSMEAIRRLKEEAYLPPFEAPYKVIIVEKAHRMMPASSNALLKTLEEPMEQCKILLVTNTLLLPTIISRCAKVFFSPLRYEDIYHFLMSTQGVESAVAECIAKKSFGSLQLALQLLKGDKWQEILCNLVLSYKNFSYKEVQKNLVELEEELEKNENISKELVYEIVLRKLRDRVVASLGSSRALSIEKIERLWQESYQSLFANVKLKIGLERLLSELYS